jgi:ubiquitin C-terminal hydrolase
MEVVEGQLIEENQINSQGECKKCKQKGVSKKQIGIIILGFYVIFSSVYGTISLLNKLKDLIF